MVNIWSGSLDDFWTAERLHRVLDKARFWALRILKPRISSYLDQWRQKHLEPKPQLSKKEKVNSFISKSKEKSHSFKSMNSVSDNSILKSITNSAKQIPELVWRLIRGQQGPEENGLQRNESRREEVLSDVSNITGSSAGNYDEPSSSSVVPIERLRNLNIANDQSTSMTSTQTTSSSEKVGIGMKELSASESRRQFHEERNSSEQYSAEEISKASRDYPKPSDQKNHRTSSARNEVVAEPDTIPEPPQSPPASRTRSKSSSKSPNSNMSSAAANETHSTPLTYKDKKKPPRRTEVTAESKGPDMSQPSSTNQSGNDRSLSIRVATDKSKKANASTPIIQTQGKGRKSQSSYVEETTPSHGRPGPYSVQSAPGRLHPGKVSPGEADETPVKQRKRGRKSVDTRTAEETTPSNRRPAPHNARSVPEPIPSAETSVLHGGESSNTKPVFDEEDESPTKGKGRRKSAGDLIPTSEKKGRREFSSKSKVQKDSIGE